MNEERDDTSPAERAVRDAVRALPRERTDDAFRAQLRHEFSSGRIGRRRERVPSRPWFARPAGWLPVAAGMALAIGLQANRGPDWRVVAANGEGRVWIADRAFAPGETQAIGLAMRRGGRVRVEGAMTLDLAAPGVAAVAIGPNADLTLSAAPNRLWGRAMDARVEAGDAYFTTGRAFHGASLAVRTPEAQVHATGTSFAVLRHDFGTCVCVMEGHVHVGDVDRPAHEAVDVPAGMRRVVGPDRKMETYPILEDSIHRLHQQRSDAGTLLGR